MELSKSSVQLPSKRKKVIVKPWTQLIIIDPQTIGYQIFKFVIVLSSIYSSVIYAEVAAFRFDLDY